MSGQARTNRTRERDAHDVVGGGVAALPREQREIFLMLALHCAAASPGGTRLAMWRLGEDACHRLAGLVFLERCTRQQVWEKHLAHLECGPSRTAWYTFIDRLRTHHDAQVREYAKRCAEMSADAALALPLEALTQSAAARGAQRVSQLLGKDEDAVRDPKLARALATLIGVSSGVIRTRSYSEWREATTDKIRAGLEQQGAGEARRRMRASLAEAVSAVRIAVLGGDLKDALQAQEAAA